MVNRAFITCSDHQYKSNGVELNLVDDILWGFMQDDKPYVTPPLSRYALTESGLLETASLNTFNKPCF